MKRLSEFLGRAVAALPPGLADRCIVFGSGPLVLAGLKEDSKDLDLFVDAGTYSALVAAGFKKSEVKTGVWAINLADDVEVYETWSGVEYPEVSLDAVPRRGSEGLRVASLSHVHKFKLASARDKDLPDIAKLGRMFKAGHVVWRAAVHEAGHVIADHHHGFVPYEVSVEDNGHGVTHSRDAWPVPASAFRYGVSCMAGLAAEEVIGVADGSSEGAASGDREKAEEALELCAQASLTEWKSRALELIEEGAHRGAVAELALELADRRELHGEELHLLIDAVLGDDSAKEKLRVLREAGNTTEQKMAILNVLEGLKGGSILVSSPLPALLVGDFSRLDSGNPTEVNGRTPEDLERANAIASRQGIIELNIVGESGMHEVTVRIVNDRVALTIVPDFEP